MPEQLLVMADNLFSVTQYPSHTVSGQEEAAGYEAYHVATGRREAGDAWRPTTANADRYVQTRCNQLRAASCLVIDRNSNLLSNARAGNTSRIQLLGSDDNFSTSRAVLDVTLASVPGGTPDSALGCITEEDAWIKTFNADAFYDWRLLVKALGSGVTPSLSGVWLGLAWQPSDFQLAFPLDDDRFQVSFPEVTSGFGWSGRGRHAVVRQGGLHIEPANDTDYDMLRWQILGLYAHGRSAWVMMQKANRPQRAFLSRIPAGVISHDLDRNYHAAIRRMDIPLLEDQPA